MPSNSLDAPNDDEADEDGRPLRAVHRRTPATSSWGERIACQWGQFKDLLDDLFDDWFALLTIIVFIVELGGVVTALAMKAARSVWGPSDWLWPYPYIVTGVAIVMPVSWILMGLFRDGLPSILVIGAWAFWDGIDIFAVSQEVRTAVAAWCFLAGLSGFLAEAVAVESRKRSASLLGVVLGPIGVIVAALMPPDTTGRS